MRSVGILPTGWPSPRGYQHGVLGQGTLLVCAGQLGVTLSGELAGPGLVAQFDQALANVCHVVRAAGGDPVDIVRLTVYLTDMPAYRASLHELGVVWQSHLGHRYPAMSVIGVAALVKPGAVVELEATALLGSARPGE